MVVYQLYPNFHIRKEIRILECFVILIEGEIIKKEGVENNGLSRVFHLFYRGNSDYLNFISSSI